MRSAAEASSQTRRVEIRDLKARERCRFRYAASSGSLNYTERSAVGVAVLVSPWNLPLYLLTFKMAPALAAGNTVVCKPSEMTSVTAWMLCDLTRQAGARCCHSNATFRRLERSLASVSPQKLHMY